MDDTAPFKSCLTPTVLWRISTRCLWINVLSPLYERWKYSDEKYLCAKPEMMGVEPYLEALSKQRFYTIQIEHQNSR